MLHGVDRVQVTAHNAEVTAERWCQLLDCTVAGSDHVEALNARRVSVRVGDSLVEILEPTGPGFAQVHLNKGRGGPFSVGVSADDVAALRRHLATLNIEGLAFDGQLFLHESVLGIAGLNVLVSPHEARDAVGLLKSLYEVTHLTLDAPRAIADIARVFALDTGAFVPIRSEQYGYEGALTLFDPEALDRIETIHPFDQGKTMGRFLERFGPSLYMCYGETDDLQPVRERLKALAPADWTGSDADDDGLFIHPKALDGVMVGVSRTTHAWSWSGHPERRIPAPVRT